MEFVIPLGALGGLYYAYTQNNNNKPSENFSTIGQAKRTDGKLSNVDVPDKNYPEYDSIQDAETDLTSKISTLNRYDGSAYTDKYFNPKSESNVIQNQIKNNTATYTSLSGQKVDASYYKHGNMQPYFGSHIRNVDLQASQSESILDNYTGAGSQIITKTERAPLFSPGESYNHPFGAPNVSDFIQSRVNPSLKMSNNNPFQEKNMGHVAPGIGAGYGSEGMGGYNSGLMARDNYMPRNVDELRVETKPKAGELHLYGHEGPANSFIKERGSLGVMEKNRVDRDFEMTPACWFTTTGIESAPMSRAIHIDRDTNRQDTAVTYSGVAGTVGPEAPMMEGEYMPSKHIDLESYPLKPAFRSGASGANDSDYGIKSQRVYQNNRSTNNDVGYLGVAKGAMTAAIAPLMDILRPSRKENVVGTLRPYQNPGTTVPNSYIFNPTDRVPTTIRETTELSNGHMFVDRMQKGGAYETNEQQPTVNNRQTQSDFYYSGVASAGERGREPRPYDAEYAQRNNDLKSMAMENSGYTPGGKNGVFSPYINMNSMPKEADSINRRDWVPTMPYQTNTIELNGKQTSSTQLNQNIQLERNAPDILSQLKGNPFVISHLNGI